MKLFVRLAPVIMLLSFETSAYSKPAYGMAGCGLGSMAMGPKGGQVSAVTTNGSFSSQGFGITLGTSNCLTDEQLASVTAQEKFLVDNLKSIAKDMAQGSGETLDGFAYTFGCKKSTLPHFANTMQKSYRNIFSSPGAMAVLSSVRDEIKSDDVLKSSCTKVI